MTPSRSGEAKEQEAEAKKAKRPRSRTPRRRSGAVAAPAELRWPVPPVRSPAARRVAEWFGLLPEPAREPSAVERSLASQLPAPPAGLALPAAGQILLIVGPSGGGKSALLRQLVARSRNVLPSAPMVLDVDRVRLGRVPCVDQFGPDLQLALDLLSRVGLGEAYTYLRLPEELSDGQRWRLRLAVRLGQAMRRHRSMRIGAAGRRSLVLQADEFCAVLDRVSAAVVARSLRRTIDRLWRVGLPIGAVVVTSHDDLEPALLPDVVARCDFARIDVAHPQRIKP